VKTRGWKACTLRRGGGRKENRLTSGERGGTTRLGWSKEKYRRVKSKKDGGEEKVFAGDQKERGGGMGVQPCKKNHVEDHARVSG